MYKRKYVPKKKEVVIDKEKLIPPNRTYLELKLSKTDATYLSSSGKNSTLKMEKDETSDTFTITEGDTGIRWNAKLKKTTFPMDMWDATFASKIMEGWILYDTEKREKILASTGPSVNGVNYAPMTDEYAARIVERLMQYANQMIEENYQKNITDVPDSAFLIAKKVLDDLAMKYEDMDNQEFNKYLDYLFSVLPRRIDKRSKYIASKNATKEDRAKIIEAERDRYDVLYTMLRGGSVNLTGKETILDVYGLEIRAFTEEEEAMAKKLLKSSVGKYVNGWRVVNKRTEKEFENFCKKENLSLKSGIDFLFHGSRSENWWSIVTNGLNINPIGVVITGKAYGQGTYFAPDAVKSLGYTSRIGAKWTEGGQSTGFMAIYKVATGNRYDGHLGCDHNLNWDKLQQIQPGAHCTWAECRYSGFMMDEVIVYKNEQSTIWGLLELSM